MTGAHSQVVVHAVGSRVWIRDDAEGWVKAEVTKLDGAHVVVQLEEGGQERRQGRCRGGSEHQIATRRPRRVLAAAGGRPDGACDASGAPVHAAAAGGGPVGAGEGLHRAAAAAADLNDLSPSLSSWLYDRGVGVDLVRRSTRL